MLSAALVAAAPTGAVETTCDLAGTWVTGYAPNYAGGAEPATPAPAHSRLEVIAAVTPFGSPPAQYVTDAFGVSALALHPNWQTCLGNGTCSADQFGNARALNAGAPPCSFIEWPAAQLHRGGSWCKAPFCTPPAPTPAPPPPVVFPKFNVTWEPTWVMSRSTISNPSGNLSGPDTGDLLAADARYGIIAFDGGHDDPHPSAHGPPGDLCRYAKTVDNAEAQARAIKAISPDTHVWTYRNQQLGLARNQHDCPKMYDPDFSGFWLKNKTTGVPLNDNTAFVGQMDQYFVDWRNASARAWWLEVKLQSLIDSSTMDGFYWDDPVFGNEHPLIKRSFTAAEIDDISGNMQRVRLEGYTRLSRGGGFCTGSTCPGGLPMPAKCPSPAVTDCDFSAPTVRKNLESGAAGWGVPKLMQMPYPDPSMRHGVLASQFVACTTGPAAVLEMPKVGGDAVVAQLTCLPGTGNMTVDFASFGYPSVGPRPAAPQCADFAANASCDGGAAVLARFKALCDGKQSCHLPTDDPVFKAPPGCAGSDAAPLRLAVRATGCALGTGGGATWMFRQNLAAFLLGRGPHAWMGHGWIYVNPPIWFPEWDVDYGVPLNNMSFVGGVATRDWTKFTVALDTETFEATFTPRA
jgi:hypothetical protein